MLLCNDKIKTKMKTKIKKRTTSSLGHLLVLLIVASIGGFVFSDSSENLGANVAGSDLEGSIGENDEIASLLKFTLPDGSNYFKYSLESGGELNGIGLDQFVVCRNGIAGPILDEFIYRCVSDDGVTFENPVLGSVPPSPYDTLRAAFVISGELCPEGDVDCGGAETYGPVVNPCSRNTFWCQTADLSYRFCSGSPECPNM